jgi:hypothetical protein
MPESIQEANVLGENDDTIDLEIVFACSPRTARLLWRTILQQPKTGHVRQSAEAVPKWRE